MIPGHNVRNTMQPTAEELLPEKARTKLEALRERCETSHAALLSAMDRVRELHDELNRNRNTLAEQEDAVAHHGKVVVERTSNPERMPYMARHRTPEAVVYSRLHPPTEEQVETQRRKVAEIEKRHQRAQAEYDRLEKEWNAVARIETRLSEYLERRLVGLSEIAEAPPVDAKPRKGETPAAAVERVRAELDGLRRELREVQTAPLPSSEAKARARAEVDALRERARPDVFALIEHGNPIRWPTTTADHYLRANGIQVGGGIQAPDAVGLMAWLFRDEMIAVLEREIDARADDEHAIPTADKPKRIAELKARILQIERTEEALIEQAEAANDFTIHRRPDVDPRAVLGLADSMPAPEGN